MQPRELAQNKAILGLSVDPQDGNRLASYAEVGVVNEYVLPYSGKVLLVQICGQVLKFKNLAFQSLLSMSTTVFECTDFPLG